MRNDGVRRIVRGEPGGGGIELIDEHFVEAEVAGRERIDCRVTNEEMGAARLAGSDSRSNQRVGSSTAAPKRPSV